MKIVIWCVPNNLGDGETAVKIFPTEDKAREFAERNEYFPEVYREVIDVDDFKSI